MDLGLNRKGVLITGGSRGIGRAIALTFAAEGAHVAICARGRESLEQTLAEVRAYSVHVFGQVADVTDREEIERFVAASAAALGGLDIVVNTMGGAAWRVLPEATTERWRGVRSHAVLGSVLLLAALLGKEHVAR